MILLAKNNNRNRRCAVNKLSKIKKITEEKDAANKIKKIKEINSGVMIINGDKLKKWLHKINNKNVQGEYYLTDLIELAVQESEIVNSHIVTDNK